MTPGFTLRDEGTPTASAGLVNGPPAPVPVGVVVREATASTLVLDWVAGSGGRLLAQPAAYDRATRAGPGGHAFLWVNAADVAAGMAWLGERPATLVASTPAGHVFAAGGQTFLFDARGLLVRAEDLDTGSALVAAGQAMGTPFPAEAEASPGVRARAPLALPFAAIDPPGARSAADEALLEVRCAGSVDNVLGGTEEAWPCGAWTAHGGFGIVAEVAFPVLASGSIAATYFDAAGDYAAVDCASPLPATSPESVTCAVVIYREWVLTGSHGVRARATFGHCLNPLTLFRCPWQHASIVHGHVS